MMLLAATINPTTYTLERNTFLHNCTTVWHYEHHLVVIF